MLLRTSRTDAYAIAASSVLALGGMLIVRNGNLVGWWILLVFSCTAVLVLLRPYLPSFRSDTDPDSLELSAWGVRRFDSGGLHEAVSWSDLREVSVVTTAPAPDDEDIYVLLCGHDDNRVMIPHTLAVESGVLSELHLRLQGFDDSAFIAALSSSAEGLFVLWRAPRPATYSGAVTRLSPVRLRAAS
jgi:hypothetical protein